MIIYLDTSVIFRIVLHAPNALREWTEITFPITSELTRVECARTLDRYRLSRHLDATELPSAMRLVAEILARSTILDVTPDILRRAALPLPVPLGTLDAIHLTTALRYRETQASPPTFATHDRELAEAAKSLGFAVIGA